MTKKMSLVALVLLLASGLAGVLLAQPLSAPVAGILDQLAEMGKAFAGPDKEPAMLVFLLTKNASVMLLILLAGPLGVFVAEKQAAIASRFNCKWYSKMFLRMKNIGGIVVPVIVLVVNGAVLSLAVVMLHRVGVPAAALAAGLAPHGVFEFAALIAACGYSLAGKGDGRERLAFFGRAVLPLLAVAAAVETYVSPALMEHFLI